MHWAHVLLEEDVVDDTIATDMNKLNQVQRQTMAKFTEMVSVERNFIGVSFGKNYYFEYLPSPYAGTIAFLMSPFTILKVISNDRSFTGPDAQMKDDVLIDSESWRVNEVNDTSVIKRLWWNCAKIEAMTHSFN